MDLKNKKVAVFGLGKSGIASAKKLHALGAHVIATDEKEPQGLDDLHRLGVELELGGHTIRSVENTDLIIVSPGVHLDIPVLEEAKRKNIPIISEIELAYRLLTKPIIAVTGTNGKTTTTTLIGEMLKAGGFRVAVAGNIGDPLVEVNDRGLDYIVAEISSYQLETIVDFKPWISLILNIQPDHLERHHTMQEYISQKARIFMNQTSDDYLIYNEDDGYVSEMVKRAKAKRIGFSSSHSAEIITLPPGEIKIPGRHNLENALAAMQAAYLCGVKKETAAEVLHAFPGVPHRIEYINTLNGVDFYNDSKGTNPDSTLVAIDTFNGKGIILILGGRDKGVSLNALTEKVKQHVKAVVLIGEAAERFNKALDQGGFKAIHHAGSMEEAVRQSFLLAKPNDVVLLSPACASFDMFNYFEERGEVFKKLCLNLAAR